METIKGLKKTKREFKSAITRSLTDLAMQLTAKEPDCPRVTAILERTGKMKQEALTAMSNLEAELDKDKKEEEAEKLSEEADALIERVDQVTSKARSFLASKVKEISSPTVANVTSEIELNTQHMSSVAISNDPNKQLERIRIPIFTGSKVEFQQWFPAFSTCIDKTSLAPEFKMLRLESCLRGEAAEAIKGLGYTQAAYDAAKARLQRKYGGDWRKVQAQIDE